MENNPEISRLLTETGAFKDLDNPVILTSGELGTYYINTEKLLQDGGKWKDFGDSSVAMIQHAIRTSKENPNFGRVIDILTETTDSLIKNFNPAYHVISGGQRRDWLFSGPVANNLGLRHVSIYKDGKMETVDTDTWAVKETQRSLAYPLEAIHIVDLVTEASSIYQKVEGIEKGWVPALRRDNIGIDKVITIVDRNQGGRERLKGVGVDLYSHVMIDEQFARDHSSNPERALAYMKDPAAWSEAYLRENGASVLVGTFDPASANFDRAKKFLNRYEGVLRNSDKLQELEDKVQEKYNISLADIK